MIGWGLGGYKDGERMVRQSAKRANMRSPLHSLFLHWRDEPRSSRMPAVVSCSIYSLSVAPTELELPCFESVLFGWQDSEVSAFCCTKGTCLVNSSNPTVRIPSITARPTLAEKEQFAQVAASSGISESALALIAIRGLLESNGPQASTTAPESGRQPATDRITIRLRPGRRARNQSAGRTARHAGLDVLAALVRAHVAARPPLTVDELAILKQGVAVLASLGRALSHISRNAAQGDVLSPDLQKYLGRTTGRRRCP